MTGAEVRQAQSRSVPRVRPETAPDDPQEVPLASPLSGPGRLVIISNRVPHSATSPGGLAVAMKDALEGRDSLWFGWSGETSAEDPGEARSSQSGRTRFLVTDLREADYAGYYEGFSNRMLWPAFHYRLDLSRYSEDDYAAYRRVNALFARRLQPHLQSSDTIWIHDYHLLPLAGELRALGVRNRIGFFSHIPFPSPEIFHAIPHHDDLIEGLASANLVGFQSARDRANFERYLCQYAGGFWRADGRVCLNDKIISARSFPIGIDAADFRRMALAPDVAEIAGRLRRSAQGRRIMLGVDRMDYSKGLPERIEAIDVLFRMRPELAGTCELVQVAPVSRGGVPAYAQLRERLETAVGHVNGVYSTLDWTPIRFVANAVPRNEIAAMMRTASLALVTPLRDGMNLVAKEYVAAQDPDDPGVLILSEFAGAAEQLNGALVINPHNPADQAEAIHRALSMPREERVERHQTNIETLRAFDAKWWSTAFLDALTSLSVDDFAETLYGAVQTARAAE